MITNREIELSFVRAQRRIEEKIQYAQAQFYVDDIEQLIDALKNMKVGNDMPMDSDTETFMNNPIANEGV